MPPCILSDNTFTYYASLASAAFFPPKRVAERANPLLYKNLQKNLNFFEMKVLTLKDNDVILFKLVSD